MSNNLKLYVNAFVEAFDRKSILNDLEYDLPEWDSVGHGL